MGTDLGKYGIGGPESFGQQDYEPETTRKDRLMGLLRAVRCHFTHRKYWHKGWHTRLCMKCGRAFI